MNKLLKNIFYLFLPIILGSFVGLIISSNIDYNYLDKPYLSPSPIVFPIIWSIIYILMGVSYFLFQKKITSNKIIISITYYFQLFVNLIWPILFFALKWRLFSIIWIFLLLYLILLLIYLMFNEHPISAYLLLPYLFWTIFATYLNIGVYILN